MLRLLLVVGTGDVGDRSGSDGRGFLRLVIRVPSGPADDGSGNVAGAQLRGEVFLPTEGDVWVVLGKDRAQWYGRRRLGGAGRIVVDGELGYRASRARAVATDEGMGLGEGCVCPSRNFRGCYSPLHLSWRFVPDRGRRLGGLEGLLLMVVVLMLLLLGLLWRHCRVEGWPRLWLRRSPALPRTRSRHRSVYGNSMGG